MGPLEPTKYGEYFHDLYLNCLDNRKSPSVKNQRNRRRKRNKICAVSNHDQLTNINRIELLPNASKFAVFSAIRSIVIESESKPQSLFDILENNKKLACHQSTKVPDGADTDGDSLMGDITEKPLAMPVPQIVGAGLKGLFELIAEARNVSPKLCTKGLRAIFDVIQGQIPESFKSEPNDLIQPLYDLLLNLATLQTGAASNADLSNWSSIACSALLGLCVARGDTGKTLKAIAALIMSSKILTGQLIQLPMVLSTLQRSIYSVALGKPTKPDFYQNGVPRTALIEEFFVRTQIPEQVQYHLQPSIASNGRYLYILFGKCLFKMGTGFNGTLKGYIYGVNTEFGKEKNGWIGFCGNSLYYKKVSKRSTESIYLINTETLSVNVAAQISIPSVKDSQNSILFSDGDSLNVICSMKDDNLVVRQLYTIGSPIPDLQLQLARKSFRTFGYATFEEELLNQQQIQKIQSSFNPFEMKLPSESEIGGIMCGKEFGLVRATNGKVFYYGKAAALGLKSVGKTPSMKPIELIVAKTSNIVYATIGHDGQHAILVNDDGNVYFTGTARRGEDGDTSKTRRQPKAVKPKKITKTEGHFIVHASCNNGTSALVTNTGKLIMLGKDTMHCDASGYVTDILDQHITKVALGKAHCVALNTKGQIFTFGMNNKGQCGRFKGKSTIAPFSQDTDSRHASSSSTLSKDKDGGGHKFDATNMCDFDDHNVVHGQCRVCTVCRECTGYNVSCVTTQNTLVENRVAGTNCACGNGEAGCSKCGACSTCISFKESDGANDAKDTKPFTFLLRQRSKGTASRASTAASAMATKDEQQPVGAEVDRDTPRVAPLPPQQVTIPTASPIIQIACGLHHTVALCANGDVFTFGSNQHGQLGTGDLLPYSGPVQVKLNSVIVQVAAGSNHTVLMSSRGVVYTFGNHLKGQLGRLPHDVQHNVNLLEELSRAAENAVNNSGDAQADVSNLAMIKQRFLWNCTPGQVSGIGPQYGKRATMIFASGDQTFFKVDESMLTGAMLTKINVVADKSTILLLPQIPMSFKCLSINRRDGNCIAHVDGQVNFARIIQAKINAISQLASDKCNQNIDSKHMHSAEAAQPPTAPPSNPAVDRMSQSVYDTCHQIFDDQDNLQFAEHHHRHQRPIQRRRRLDSPFHSKYERIMPQLAFELDPSFGVLWVFDAVEKKCSYFNVIGSEIPRNGEYSNNILAILTPELVLPKRCDATISRNLAAVNLLACFDVLTSVPDAIPSCFEQSAKPMSSLMKDSVQVGDFQTVTRFENFGGGWGYSGQSVEAIRFMADTDVILVGFGMYGGRGEYTCKIKVFDLGMDGGGYEKEGILLVETDDVPYECPARSKHNIFLPKTVTLNAGRWYLVWTRIAGPSSDCGSAGQTSVTTEDQIVFNFRTSKKANNCTDVNSGQIPTILYRVINQESKQPSMNVELDPVHKVSPMFASTVTKDCFQSLIALLKWSWAMFKQTLVELKDRKNFSVSMSTCRRLHYVSQVCLRLLRKYTNEIYPNELPKIEKPQPKPTTPDAEDKNEPQLYALNQSAGPSSVKQKHPLKQAMSSSLDATTSANPKKTPVENLQLAECIGDVRALLIDILCDEIALSADSEGYESTMEILDECHTTFLSCFNAFYPTNTLKWNCLCDLLMKKDKGVMHARLLSAILAGLCNPNVKLKSTFPLLSSTRESMSIISPSDNAGLPMLSSTENYQYPVLVEQMTYRTQLEKNEYLSNTWTFNDILVRLLDIVSYPIKSKIDNIQNRCGYAITSINASIHQKLIDNCCHLLARVLSEIVFQSCPPETGNPPLPAQSIRSTGCRFARRDPCRTWNTGNFGPDAICFSVDRRGIAIAGAMVYSGTGSYEYQLELLYDSLESHAHHKWETIESISGSYDQDVVQNEMAEIKFERPVHIKENTRYAIRLSCQGARTCSGDAGFASVRGPCGTMFSFYPCDLSFNGTTPSRGQIPCLLYYGSPLKTDTINGKIRTEIHARDTALKISSDITKKCTELLIFARNALAASITPTEKSLNSSNNTQTIDSEQNITPIEEHFDINFANNPNVNGTPTTEMSNASTARDITKRFESFSKGIMETLKFDKRSTNPFEYEIEIGATEIHPKDLIKENEINKSDQLSKINGNNGDDRNYIKDFGLTKSDDSVEFHEAKILDIFEHKTASIFHTLLPLIFGHIAALASSDPRSSVQVLTLIREILPHVAALNKSHGMKEQSPNKMSPIELNGRDEGDDVDDNFGQFQTDDGNNVVATSNRTSSTSDLVTTSNHYCIVESEHPYKSASINSYTIEFPPCVQWFTIEFDSQCGTAQVEDYLLVSIPKTSMTVASNGQTSISTLEQSHCLLDDISDAVDGFNSFDSQSLGICKNARLSTSADSYGRDRKSSGDEDEWHVAQMFNKPSHWTQNALVLPGNKVTLSLETATNYARDQHANTFGFKCLIIGYDNPSLIKLPNSTLNWLECELAYLGGMCSASLMKKDLILPGENPLEDFSSVEDTMKVHSSLLSKGLALSDAVLTVNQALDSYLPVGVNSNERQFLKDFVDAVPGSSGARLAAWLQPESRLDPNKCELKVIEEPVRFGWPTQLKVITRDQYGDAVYVPHLKIQIKASPSVNGLNGNRKGKRLSQADAFVCKGMPMPPRIPYEATVKDKMCFKAITFMKPYQQFSFEELRYCNPSQNKVSEVLQATDSGDLSYGTIWTPNSIGHFSLVITIDGVALEEVTRIEVKEAGILPPPPQKLSQQKSQPQNKLRKFRASNSAGLRIRSHPTLQSEQVGIVQMDGIISFIDEIENDDGVWVRLSTESIRQHCEPGWYPLEAWCLQFNQHIDKRLLHPVIEPCSQQYIESASDDLFAGTTPTSDTPTLSANVVPEVSPRKSSRKQKHVDEHPPAETNPFKTAFGQNVDDTQAKPLPRSSRNPFEKLAKRSGKVLDDPDDLDEYGSPDEGECSVSNVNVVQSKQSASIGTWTAGMMGGGSSKLQAIQKWFKSESFDARDSSRRRGDLSELASVSVRDLVKAIGAAGSNDSPGKGNGNSPQQLSQCSSPISIPFKQSAYSSSSKSVEVSEASGLQNSLSFSDTKENIPESILGDSNSSQTDLDTLPSTRSRAGYFDSDQTFSTAEPPPSPRKQLKRTITVSMDYQSCSSPLKTLNKSSTSAAASQRGQGNFRRDSIDGDANKHERNENPEPSDTSTAQPKRALPAGLAESFRAVFAAFLWHEGLAHDAMACSSFLKFHPSLPKRSALTFANDEIRQDILLSREQRARQRYSVEVANAGNYLNIRPSTLETLNKSGQSSISNRRNRKVNAESQITSPDFGKLDALQEMPVIASCPPALRCLVFLWEQISANCIQLAQSNNGEEADDQQQQQQQQSQHQHIKEIVLIDDNQMDDFDLRKSTHRKEDGAYCELCEIFLPIPVTYHMRMIHPGCGQKSRSKGYNSVGAYCDGWAGNCGEGGKGASSWYLMCENCRDRYMERIRNDNNVNTMSNAATFLSNHKLNSMVAIKSNCEFNSDLYAMMRENALFLLELSSTNSSMLTNQKRPPFQMPVVNENQIVQSDLNRPSTSRNEWLPSNRFSMRSFKSFSRKSEVLSPDQMWLTSDTFACLDALGVAVAKETAPYDMFSYTAENGYDRPLSDLSLDITSGGGQISSISNASNIQSKFHRSMSMGQGWPSQSLTNRYSYQNDDNFDHQKVVLRRKNPLGSDSDGSSSLCQPSENLRKLVPEEVFNFNAAVQSYSKMASVMMAAPSKASAITENLDAKNENDVDEPFLTIDGDPQDHEFVMVARHGEPRAKQRCAIESFVGDVDMLKPASNAALSKMPNLLARPTIAFCFQSHNLERLRYAMKRNLRIATLRLWALQAMNCLIKTVTQPVCLHDIMWWFVSSLNPVSAIDSDDVAKYEEQALEHPIAAMKLGGKISLLLTQSLHAYLQSVADLTLLLPCGSALQQLAIQCFGIRFRQTDHHFLHQSHVFGNISKILSKSDEMREQQQNDEMPSLFGADAGTKYSSLIDMSGMFEVNVSSRQSMVPALIDASTETFWESDEEDRNRSKTIEISLNKFDFVCRMICVHIDNTRDVQNKVTNIQVYGGQSLGDTALIKSYDINSKTGLWLSTRVTDDAFIHFRIELKGSETLRVRQVKLLGVPIGGNDESVVAGGLKSCPKQINTYQIQHRNCETETLRVFRLLTAQVFGKLILGNDQELETNRDDVTSANARSIGAGAMESNATSMLADSLDLREHMVGILFSRSRLSHLQKQVIVHIVYAIRKETLRAKDEWEAMNVAATYTARGVIVDVPPLISSEHKSESASENSRAPDVYCFEMLSMVLALSGSAVGRSYLSNQHGLLKDLLTLLHTGSDRVQRQVTSLLRRILPEVSPDQVAELLGVQHMPPNDFSIVSQSSEPFDMHRLGILDIFLAIIAKSLQLQVKIKSNGATIAASTNKQPISLQLCNCIDFKIVENKMPKKNQEQAMGTSSYNECDADDDGIDFEYVPGHRKVETKNLNQRWFLKGTINIKQAENIIALIRDMANGKLSDKWSTVTKAAIAESILNLTRLEEMYRTHENCIKTATLWLALASLCVLDKDHVEKLSSGQWSKSSETRPLCGNHGDGKTPAVIQCDTCIFPDTRIKIKFLCADCDHFLHLNPMTRNHHRTVCKEEEDAIRVELHEGCGRTKLFWLLALADSRTLKAIIEFRDGSSAVISGPTMSTGRCRFCGAVGDSGLLAMGNVCADVECQEHAANICAKTKPCGHPCGGVLNETKCLPCLEVVCHKRENDVSDSLKEPKLKQDADDMCMICFVEALSCAPAIQLKCGHVFHYRCCRMVLEKRWSGPRISFGFSLCPICKTDIAHLLLADLLDPINELKADVEKKAVMRLEYEGVLKSTNNHKDMVAYAIDRYAYYVCFKCTKAYYGGEARCDAEMGDKFNPTELICGGCSDVARAKMCPKHGTDYLEYKCRFCCSVAVYFCFGSTHFCDTCHDDFQRLTNIPKHKLPKCPAGPKAKQLLGEDCPLHVVHPPTGEEFALGCGICRNAQTF